MSADNSTPGTPGAEPGTIKKVNPIKKAAEKNVQDIAQNSSQITKQHCILEVYKALIIANGRTTHADRVFMENMADNAVIHGTTIYEKMQ